ncbi:N(4)-(beta-N-acetylglucosaminyl)-L-asparaginase [Planctomycetaceae bacterium SH139]
MTQLRRRNFHSLLGLGFAAAMTPTRSTAAQNPAEETPATETPAKAAAAGGQQAGPLAIATWSFGLAACQQAVRTMTDGGHRLDGVEQGIRVTEADAENRSVGIGGIPNADGVVQLDACIMDGPRQRAGAVSALEDYPHPISVARRVMEKTPHVMLTGAGAADFAAAEGFPRGELLVPRERDAHAKWQANRKKPVGGIDPVDVSKQAPADDRSLNHDTIALLALDSAGELAGGCSTSGWGYKLAGRVGDSPIIGSGLYVDGLVGAAGATGLGEITMRYCGSFLVVEAMRRGASPEDACLEAIERILAGERRAAKELSVNFIALAKNGRVGAAGTDVGFRYAVVAQGVAEVRTPTILS